MWRTIFITASLIVAILVFFRLSTYGVLSGSLSTEVALVTVAAVFLFVGMLLNKRRRKKKRSAVSELDPEKIKEIGLSKREYEVLQEIALGLSNKQIAEKLFLSESTIKTHVSSVLLKLNAERRTQALQKASELGIL